MTMLNITQGNPIPLSIQLQRNGADFDPGSSKDISVGLTDYFGVSKTEKLLNILISDGKIFVTIPPTIKVGRYGIEISGSLYGSDWRTKYNDVLKITDETVADLSNDPVTMTGDYYDIIIMVNFYGSDDSTEVIRELERLRGEVDQLTGELAQKDYELGQMSETLSQKDAIISGKEEVISGLEGDLQESQLQLSDMTDERDKAALFIGSYLIGGADIEVPSKGELNIRYGTLEVPAGFTEIGDNAFRLRDNIINIDLGGVEIIRNNVFRESTIQSVRGENVTLFGESCFRDCPNLVDVYLPNLRTTNSTNGQFGGCLALESVSLPSLTSCNQTLFSGCSKLKNVHLPSLASTGNAVFQNCYELEEISLPSLMMLSPNTFLNCNKLRKVDFTNLNSFSSNINQSSLETIILRKSSLTSLSSTSYINNTCTVYVPDELVDEYKAANNWKNHASQIKGLSEYVE